MLGGITCDCLCALSLLVRAPVSRRCGFPFSVILMRAFFVRLFSFAFEVRCVHPHRVIFPVHFPSAVLPSTRCHLCFALPPCCLTNHQAMQGLSPQEFEGVLHPVFEEDEWKLILVGAALGAAVGVFQLFVLF